MNGITLFYGKTNPEFSNFYIAPFTVDGEVYNSVEHYFITAKARLFDPNGEAIKQMSNDKTPAQMKKLGRQVKNFHADTWSYRGREAMYEAVFAKFNSNPLLKDKLLDTGYNILAEASPFDKKWGIGLGISSPNVNTFEKWGSNWLGLILMSVRAELRYGRVDYENIHETKMVTTYDFFYGADWDEWVYEHNLNPKKFENDHYITLCAQAVGYQYFGSPAGP